MDYKNNLTVRGDRVEIGEPVIRYCRKMMGSLGKYVPKASRRSATMSVTVARVDRAHGNTYDAAVRLVVGDNTFEAADSTLNAFAALDIVHAKLLAQMKRAKEERDGARRL